VWQSAVKGRRRSELIDPEQSAQNKRRDANLLALFAEGKLK
jgi:hypothetical protein